MRRSRYVFLAVLLGAAVAAVGCRSGQGPTGLSSEQLDAAVAALGAPRPGGMGVLYRLRTPTSSRLRLAVLTAGQEGRMTVSEPFGAALSISAWDESGSSVFLDLQAGCRLDSADVSSVFRLDFVPLPEVALLLGGRLPALSGDSVQPTADGRLLISGQGWACLVSVEPDPWRVVAVEETTGTRARGWRLKVSEHRESVPRALRLQLSATRWAELDLVRLEWNPVTILPALPDLPECRSTS